MCIKYKLDEIFPRANHPFTTWEKERNENESKINASHEIPGLIFELESFRSVLENFYELGSRAKKEDIELIKSDLSDIEERISSMKKKLKLELKNVEKQNMIK